MKVSIHELLEHIDPSELGYQEWVSVGMALHHEGESAELWDLWSQRDSARYKPGDCHAKWRSFGQGGGSPVTGGTLHALAKQHGWSPPPERVYDWDSPITFREAAEAPAHKVLDPEWLDCVTVEVPANWNPVQDLIDYLGALYEATEFVSYVVESREGKDGKWDPGKGSCHRTAGELIDALRACNGDIGAVLGDYNPKAGAWIRINPMDGKDQKRENVTSYRYALIESDTESIEKQRAIYDQLELPIVALVHSGKRSLHAIVKIDAATPQEHRDRFMFLHKVLKENGLEVDTNNKDVARLSRMPGVMRDGHPQFLVGLRQGKRSYEEWKEYIEGANDNLPDIECLEDVFGALPPLASPLIHGVLRRGHKLLLSGPSKAGKSFMLLQLAVAVAEGGEWLGWPCAQGRVLYVNLELDRASCLHRLRDLYGASRIVPANLAHLDIWNLRGQAVPMDKLAPMLIRRALKRRYDVVIIDPIYKVLTGDENAADKMAFFCNQFDRVCHELGAAVIYCHHHSKGSQGQKQAQDRASGSGVFARDPDAILDLIELNVTEAARATIVNRAKCNAAAGWLDVNCPRWRDVIGPDDALVADKFIKPMYEHLSTGHGEFIAAIREAEAAALRQSGWRVEGTLREFPAFPPRRVWFRYPVHQADTDGLLADAKAEGEEAPWAAAARSGRDRQPRKGKPGINGLAAAYTAAT